MFETVHLLFCAFFLVLGCALLFWFLIIFCLLLVFGDVLYWTVVDLAHAAFLHMFELACLDGFRLVVYNSSPNGIVC